MATPETTFCPNCGERISARARFCPSCGARQEDFHVPTPEPEEPPAAATEPIGVEARDEFSSPVETPARPAEADEPPAGGLWSGGEPEPPPPEPEPPPPPRREPLTERIGRVDPQAGELTGLLRERLAVPGMVGAGLAALIAAAIVLAAGVLLAVITPDDTILGFMGLDTGLVPEVFRQASGMLLISVVQTGPLLFASGRLDPLILVAIPVGAMAFATRRQLGRTEGAQPYARLGWAAAGAVPFALLMLAFAIAGGGTDSTGVSPSEGGAFGLGLLWGLAGASIGAVPGLELRGPDSPALRRTLIAARATLRPLAAILVVCTVAGLAGWLIQVARGVDEVRIGRTAPAALIEEAAFVGEHGIGLAALAGGARFRADAPRAMGLPFPVARPDSVAGQDVKLRIFGYADALPAYVFLPALVLLLGLLALGALYAGFAAARALDPGSVAAGAAWGAITGPAWAIAMAILAALAGGAFHGDPEGASVFGVFLLGGLLLGAAGGALGESG